MAGITKACADFLANWVKSTDEIMTNPVLSTTEVARTLSETAEKALKEPSVRERIGAYVRNSYLSGPSTHVINIASQTAQLATAPLLRAVSGRPGEAVAMLRGVVEGFQEAFPRFLAGLNKRSQDFDGNQHQSYDIVKNKFADYVLTFPTTLTGALDSGFSAVLERMEFRAMINRIATKFPDEYFTRQNTTREALVKELEEIALKRKDGNALMLRTLEDKDPALRWQLENFAAFNTYRTPLGRALLDELGQLVAKAKNIAPELNLVVPFLRTGINIAKEAGGYIPGGGLLRVAQAKKDIKDIKVMIDGGEIKNKIVVGLTERIRKAEESLSNAVFPGQIEKAQAKLDKLLERKAKLEGEIAFKQEKIPDFYAQQAIGIGMMMSTYAMVNQGVLTGHYSSDPATRTAQMASGIPPMSIKIGDRWFSYERIEPLATVMGIVVDSMNAYKEGQISGKDVKLATSAVRILSENFLNKTFTEGLGKMLLAFQEPDRFGEAFAVSLTNPVVPSILNQIARIEDPIQREVKDPELAQWIINNLKARLPGLRDTLPGKVNLLGQTQEMSVGSILSGIQSSPVEREAVNTIFDNPYLRMERMDRKVGGLELTPEQYIDMEDRAGDRLNQAAQILVRNPGFNAMPRPLQARLIKGIAGEIRQQERLRTLSVLVQDPQKRADFILNLQRKQGMQPDFEDMDEE
jgi:hypothetical protein